MVLGILSVAVSFGLFFLAFFLSIGLGMTCEDDCSEATAAVGFGVGNFVVQVAAFVAFLYWRDRTAGARGRLSSWVACAGYVAVNRTTFSAASVIVDLRLRLGLLVN